MLRREAKRLKGTLVLGLVVALTAVSTVPARADRWDGQWGPSTPAYEDLADAQALRGEIDALRERGGADASIMAPQRNWAYSAWMEYYFSPTGNVTREQFFGMLGRAFHVAPSWAASPFSDYTPATATQSKALWFTRNERSIKQVTLTNTSASIYAVVWNDVGKTWEWKWYGAQTGVPVNLPAETKAIVIEGNGQYNVRVTYEDGTQATYNVNQSYYGARMIPPIDSYYPWVRGTMTMGWAHGYQDGTFRPQNTMTRLEAMVSLVRAMGYVDFARLLSKEQVDWILGRFWDSNQIPQGLRPEVATLVLSGVTRGYGDGSLRPGSYTERQHAAAFINRASRVVVQPSINIWSPDGDGVNDSINFRIVPGFPYRIIGGNPPVTCRTRYWYDTSCKWTLSIYYLPESGGWEQLVASKDGWQLASDASQNFVETDWTPGSKPKAGIYLARGQLYLENPYYATGVVDFYSSPLAPFEIIYPTLSASASASQVRPGGSLTITALTTGRAQWVGVWVPVAGGGRELLDLTKQWVAGQDPIYGPKEQWAVNWDVPVDLEGGDYTLTVVATYPDGSTRTATVSVKIYGPTASLEVQPGDAVRVGSPVNVVASWCDLNNVQIDLTSLGGGVIQDNRRCASRTETLTTPDPGIYTVCMTGQDDFGQLVKRCVTVSFWNVETYLIPEEKVRHLQP